MFFRFMHYIRMKFYCMKRIYIFCLLLCAVTWAEGADWPQWRGSNRDGICSETGLLKQWPSGGPRLLWKANGLGSGYSTLAIAGDRIFTVGEREDASFV